MRIVGGIVCGDHRRDAGLGDVPRSDTCGSKFFIIAPFTVLTSFTTTVQKEKQREKYQGGVNIEFAEVNNDGEITLESIEKKITAKTKMIAVTHLSNVTGAILPIKEITGLAHSKGIPVLVDGCQGAPHLKLDMQDLDCDFYVMSCHKMYGPTGLGVLYAKKKWLEELPPYQGGGGMIREVKKEEITYGDLPNKYEAGTMATAQVIAFNESIKFLKK